MNYLNELKEAELSKDELQLMVIKLMEVTRKLADRLNEVENKLHIPNKSVNTTDTTNTNQTEYPSVEDAPEWKIAFKVNTSEGISTQKVIQKAWTEKQAIFLGRTEQLFGMMNELVKAKQIQAKWNILESSAEKFIQ